MCTKVTVFNNRKSGKKHHLKDIKRALFNQLKIEEYHAIVNQKEYFQREWNKIYNELTMTLQGM